MVTDKFGKRKKFKARYDLGLDYDLDNERNLYFIHVSIKKGCRYSKNRS